MTPAVVAKATRQRINSVKNEMAFQRAASGHLAFTNVFLVFSFYQCTLSMIFMIIKDELARK